MPSGCQLVRGHKSEVVLNDLEEDLAGGHVGWGVLASHKVIG